MPNEMPITITRKHRSCLNCTLIRQGQNFKQNGCPNCPILNINRSSDNYYDATSEAFNGLICLIKPNKSWVGKWQRIENKVPGAYAMTVDGVLPDEFVNRIEEHGLIYYERDKSFTPNQ